MKHRSKFLILITAGCLYTLCLPEVSGQTTFRQTTEAYLTIAGTSTLHDWTMTSSQVNCQAEFILNPDGTPAQLSRLAVTLSAESLKSDKEAMDKNAYKALKTEKHKNITFQLLSAVVQNNVVAATGNLTISGVTQRVDLQATCAPQSDKTIRCTGKKEIKMSDYKVEPPSFMFGTVRTGDSITLSFDVKLAAGPSANP